MQVLGVPQILWFKLSRTKNRRTWRRLGFCKGNSYYIRTISARYPKRTSAVRPYGICTVSVRYLYGIFRTSGIWDVQIPSLYAPIDEAIGAFQRPFAATSLRHVSKPKYPFLRMGFVCCWRPLGVKPAAELSPERNASSRYMKNCWKYMFPLLWCALCRIDPAMIFGNNLREHPGRFGA